MKKILLMITAVVILCMSASFSVSANGILPRLVDEADILTNSEEEQLTALLDEISEHQQVDIAVYAAESIGDYSAMDYADNVFESFGYGMDADRSCILLLVCPETRDWHITTAGYGITAVTDVGLKYMSGQFVPYLSEGEYYRAFKVYADYCDDFIERARAGDPFDTDDLPKEPFPAARNLVICLVIGIIVAWIITGKQKSQLITVRKQDSAKTYTKNDSMRVTESKDFFLYRTVNRTEKSDSSSGGSSTHKTNSGTTVGGGGGKF